MKQVENPKDAGKLEEIDTRFRDAKQRWEPMWKERTVDMRFIDGDTLDPTERNLRKQNGRPWFDLDEINQYENQVINDILPNKRGVKFSPKGNGANDRTARFYAGKMREIEYRSKAAKIAYPMALKNCVWGGFGYVRLVMKHKPLPPKQLENGDFDPSAMMQDLWVEQVSDPNTILPDPDFQMPDLSDAGYLLVLEQYTHDEFVRMFPWAQVKSFSNEHIKASKGWVKTKSIQVAEYWWMEQTPIFTLALIEDAQGNARVVKADVLEQQGLPQGWEFKREREVQQPVVKEVLTNGVEILERNDWPGIYLPFAGCMGKMFWRDKGSGSERVIHSMTRLARNPATLYSYYNTVEGELLRLVPKFPYFYFDGTLSPEMLLELQKSYDQPVVAIGVKPNVDGTSGQPLGFPQRAPYEPPILALQAGKESARQGVRAAMGLLPLPTDAGKQNNKSGVALREMKATGQQGAFHWQDALNLMVEFVGVQCEDLIPKVLVGQREETIYGDDMKPQRIWINAQAPEGSQEQGGDEYLASIEGYHEVTVSVGPSEDSEREQAKDFVDTLVGSELPLQIAGPEGAKKILAEGIRLQNLGPIGDKMAEVYDPQEQQPGMDPAQAQQMLQEAQQIMQQQAQVIQDLEAGMAKTKMETESRERIKQAEIANDQQLARLQAGLDDRLNQRDNATKLEIQRMKDQIDRMEALLKQAQMASQQAHEAEMGERESENSRMESAEDRHFQAREGQANRDAAERQAAMKPKAGE